MPITKSAKKRLRQDRERRRRNLTYLAKIKTASRNTRQLAAKNKLEEAKKLLPLGYKALDKAAKAGVIKKNKADRLKSRLAKTLKPEPQKSPGPALV